MTPAPADPIFASRVLSQVGVSSWRFPLGPFQGYSWLSPEESTQSYPDCIFPLCSSLNLISLASLLMSLYAFMLFSSIKTICDARWITFLSTNVPCSATQNITMQLSKQRRSQSRYTSSQQGSMYRAHPLLPCNKWARMPYMDQGPARDNLQCTQPPTINIDVSNEPNTDQAQVRVHSESTAVFGYVTPVFFQNVIASE